MSIQEFTGYFYQTTINTFTSPIISIIFCYFLLCSNSNNGGAIYSTSNLYNFQIIHNIFEKCSTSGSGGGIYISENSNTYLEFCCGYECFASSSNYGQFIYISSTNLTFQTSTYSRCPSTRVGKASIRILSSYQYLTQINSTNNFLEQESGIMLSNTINSNSKYINLYNNSCETWLTINYFYGQNYYCNFYNIIKNLNKGTSLAHVQAHASFVYINNSIILYNSLNNKLYCTQGTSSLTLINSFSDNYLILGNIFSNNLLITSNYYTYIFSLLSTGYCKAQFNFKTSIKIKKIKYFYQLIFIFIL